MPSIVVLDAVDTVDGDPEYCVHGKTMCMTCGTWCYLGTESYKVVASGAAQPTCQGCATLIMNLPENRSAIPNRRKLHDHRRSDGPHT